ncbi:MAG: D-tyrosyl-tRNA(Tyr) deacylase [Bacteroidetes bacterium]|nr:D-tyrosyl-tRNA(Tyr) deacylase [Bacteroidota bacterium]
MRIVIQRVTEASLKIEGTIYAEIANGLVVLLGIEHTDSQEDVDYLVAKLLNLRIFNDAEGKMNLSLQEVQGELLVVSQFTLHASTKKGNRPSYIRAARPEHAIPLYESFIKSCHILLPDKTKTGVFGSDMKISLVNDGPVTICMDSKNRE